MNKKTILISGGLLICSLISYDAFTNASGAPANRNGSPTSISTCATAGCHAGPAATDQSISISTNIPASGFIENTDYEITVTANAGSSSSNKIGFQTSVESGGHVGTLATGGNTAIQLVGNHITHTSSGTAATGGQRTWVINWNSGTAPDGTTIYVAANFTNSNGTTTGDVVITEDMALMKNTGVSISENEIAAYKMFPNPASSRVSLSDMDATIRQVELVDLGGKVVRTYTTESLVNSDWELSLDGLQQGVYFIKAGNLEPQKLIIGR